MPALACHRMLSRGLDQNCAEMWLWACLTTRWVHHRCSQSFCRSPSVKMHWRFQKQQHEEWEPEVEMEKTQLRAVPEVAGFPCCWRQCGHHTGGTKGRSPYAFGVLMLIGPIPVGSPRSLSKWRKLGDPQAFASYCPGWKILILCPRRKISERPSDIKS